MSQPRVAKQEQDVKPLRVKPRTAAKMLDLEHQTVRLLMMQGVFTVIRPDGGGPGSKTYLVTAEVEAFAFGGREAVAKLRKQSK